ncbi:MAG: 30S ribosomal protein S16 [Dermatophilaceae bacterium]
MDGEPASSGTRADCVASSRFWQTERLYPSGRMPRLVRRRLGPDAYTEHPAPRAISRGLAALTMHEETTTVAVKIRLKRMGKIRAPFYRVVVMDSRTKRDGRAIEEIGKYHPTAEPSLIEIDSERVQYWLGNGAQPTEATMALLKVTGDWQKFRGEPGAEGTLKVKEPKPAKKDLYEAAVAAAGGSATDDGSGATTPRKRAAKKAAPAAEKAAPAAEKAAPVAEKAAPVAEADPVDASAETPAAESAVTETPATETAADAPAAPEGAAPESPAADTEAKDS